MGSGEGQQTRYRERIYERYARLFIDAPEQFDVNATRRWGRAYKHYLRGWLPDSREAVLVDAACGGGRLLHFFREQGYSHVSGVDISADQIALARQTSTEVTEGDAIAFLEARHGQFDLIAGLDIVEHFQKPEVLRFLDACHGALRSRGRLILQTPNADSPWGMMHRYNDFTHEVAFNPNALSRLMRLVGFGNIETREVGPIPFGYSVASTVRYLIWQSIRAAMKVWNVAETGSPGSGVFTRVFLITGVKG